MLLMGMNVFKNCQISEMMLVLGKCEYMARIKDYRQFGFFFLKIYI